MENAHRIHLINKCERFGARWRKSKTRRSPSSPQILQKYIYTWNCSYRTPTERWQKTSDLPKGKKLPTYLGRAKEKRNNRDKRIGTDRHQWEAAVKEERFPHTRKLLRWWRLRVAEGGASEPRRRAQPQGCGGKSGEILAQRLGAEQHSAAREACLLTRGGGRGLGAEARASVGSQGEDWGWLCEHSLKGLVRHSWLGGSPGKSLQLPKRQETFSCLFVSRGARRGDSEHRLNELQRRARAVAISADPRDGHETLRLLLPPPRSLCAAQITLHTAPPGSLCSPPLPGSRDPGTTSPGERTARLRLLQRHVGLCRRRLALHPYPSLPPA